MNRTIVGLLITASFCALASAGPLTVAVAVVTDEKPTPAVQKVETLLTAELAKKKDVTLVDRQQIQKVLAVHKNGIAGVIRQPARVGKLLGAQHFISLQAVGDRPNVVGALCIDVSTGNVLWEGAIRIDKKSDPLTAWVKPIYEALIADKDKQSSPTAAVLTVTNKSTSRRMDFLQTTVQHLMEDVLAGTTYRVLRRRRPGLLGTETALGASGLVRPDAAVIAQAADLSISAVFTESPSTTVAFEETPITLVVTLKAGNKPPVNKTLTFTIKTMETLQISLQKILPEQVRHRPHDRAIPTRIEAARLMATLKDIRFTAPLDQHRRKVKIARKVLYLDPSAKEAYYHLGTSLDAIVVRTARREETSQDARDALVAYTRFPRTNPKHVYWAFSYAMRQNSWIHGMETLYKGAGLYKEYIRWVHSLDPVGPPSRYPLGIGGMYTQYRDPNNPKRYAAQLKLLEWIDTLYAKKKHRSVVGDRRARVLGFLGRKKESAEFLYDYIVSQKRRWPGGVYSRASVQALASLLPERQGQQLIARYDGKNIKPPRGILAGFYGESFGNARTFREYEEQIAKHPVNVQPERLAKTEPVVVTPKPYQTLSISATPAGLWVQVGAMDKTLHLLHSTDGKAFHEIPLPKSWQKPMSGDMDAALRNLIHGIEQVGDEVLFATHRAGMLVYNVKTQQSRLLTSTEGLGSDQIRRITPDADRGGLWIIGGDTATRYAEGKLFLSTTKVSRFPNAAASVGRELILATGDKIDAYNMDSGKRRQIYSREKFHRESMGLTTSPYLRGPRMHYNSGDRLFDRMCAVGDTVYWVSGEGLLEMSLDGKKKHLWSGDRLRHDQMNLGGWIQANSPIPPGLLFEVVPDDKDPHLLWLLVQSRDLNPYERFVQSVFPSPLSGIPTASHSKPPVSHLLAFNTKTRMFSRPRKLRHTAFHIQPFGDYIYQTGYEFRRGKKAQYKTDQPANDRDVLATILTPDTPMGHVSKAWLRGKYVQAFKRLEDFLTKNPQHKAALQKTRHRLKRLAETKAVKTRFK